MQGKDGFDVITFQDIGRFLAKYGLVLMGLPILGVVLGIATYVVSPKHYLTSMVVQVESNLDDNTDRKFMNKQLIAILEDKKASQNLARGIVSVLSKDGAEKNWAENFRFPDWKGSTVEEGIEYLATYFSNAASNIVISKIQFGDLSSWFGLQSTEASNYKLQVLLPNDESGAVFANAFTKFFAEEVARLNEKLTVAKEAERARKMAELNELIESRTQTYSDINQDVVAARLKAINSLMQLHNETKKVQPQELTTETLTVSVGLIAEMKEIEARSANGSTRILAEAVTALANEKVTPAQRKKLEELSKTAILELSASDFKSSMRAQTFQKLSQSVAALAHQLVGQSVGYLMPMPTNAEFKSAEQGQRAGPSLVARAFFGLMLFAFAALVYAVVASARSLVEKP